MVGVLLPVTGLFHDLGQDLPLAGLVQNGLVVLVFIGGHFLGQIHTLQEEVQQLVVYGIDFFANLRKFHGYPPTVSLKSRRR